MNMMMKRVLIGTFAFIVFATLGLAAQDEGFYPYSFARLSYISGSVYVQRTSDLGYEKGEVNLALVQGDKLGTETGQAEIHFGRRNYLRLDDNTKVEFAVLPTEGDERIKIHLTEGTAYFRVSHLALDKGIEIHTPDASFYVLEEGLYRFDVRLDRETQVFVREGSLEAAAEEGSVLVRGQETVTAADGRLLGDPEYGQSREDSFDDWNGSRDAQFAQRSERQYLPSEIEEYEEELDQNGQWVYERPYGNVWVPNVYYDDWRPYYYGRWVWYPIIGWTWVSSESWGWPVYHYGRWNWRFGLGWYWIPRHHWGPAWVHWWWDHDYIGWCPLTWYDRPGLLVNNRFYDRYDDRYFSAHNRAMTVVHRDHLQSPDIGRRHLGSGELARIDRVDLRAQQPSIRPTVDNGRPQALAAQRALANRPGERSRVRSIAPSNSLSSSSLRQNPGARGARTIERNASLSDPGRGSISRSAVRSSEPGGRAIRSYPSQRLSGSRRDGSVDGSRGDATAGSVRRSGAQSGGSAARVSPSQGQTTGTPRSATDRSSQRARTIEKRSEGAVTGKSAAIRNRPSTAPSESTAARERSAASSKTIRSFSEYPSRSNGTDSPASRSITGSARRSSETSSGRSQSPTYSSRSAVSRSASRLSSPSSSSPRSLSSSRPSSYRPSSLSRSRSSSPSSGRSISSSSSRSGSPRPQSYSRPGSSYSSPSRTAGSSGRSYSAPRSTGSSSGRSYSAPRSGGSSSGRSYSSPRSSGSSRSGSSSSGRSGSSSSRSSGSSSRSGSSRRKG